MENLFLLPTEEYKRDIQPVYAWLEQTAWFASKKLNLPYDACLAHLKKKLNNKDVKIQDPTVVFFHRGENGDRERITAPLLSYIRKNVNDGNIIAPTFTTYLPPSKLQSPIVGYLDKNVLLRKGDKKKAMHYEMLGDKVNFATYNNRQDNRKRANNAVSGGFVSKGSIIQNPTGHSTLTSITRSIASLSNSSNERMIQGNRHYYTPEITINNIISICVNSDLALIDEVIRTYKLYYPTLEQTSAAVRRSFELYCRDNKAFDRIHALLATLTNVERAAVVYTGDLYHLMQVNPAFIKVFLERLSCIEPLPPELYLDKAHVEADLEKLLKDPVAYIYSTDEQVVNYAHQVNLNMMRGKGKDYKEKLTYDEQVKLAKTCLQICETVKTYKPLIRAFFLTKNSPCTTSTIQQMIRRSVVLSDTDSTMFSVDNWVIWYFGKLGFEDKHYALAGAITYLATQSISHILAIFSANLGVEQKRLYTLAMKPEFVFPVFAQTSVAKHYYTARQVKEGNVYKDIEMEVKGVHLIDSTVPQHIIKAAKSTMEESIRTVMRGEELDLLGLLKKTADLEREIRTSIQNGETKYLKTVRIKDRASYKQEDGGIDKTPYRYHTCWINCFSQKYGNYGNPTYYAVRVPLNLPNRSSTLNWLASCPDRNFAQSFAQWLSDHNTEKLGQLPIPLAFASSHGIPKELLPIIDDRRVALSLTLSFRNIIESYGFFPKNDLLISEMGY